VRFGVITGFLLAADIPSSSTVAIRIPLRQSMVRG
jgi:hypothetical protein